MTIDYPEIPVELDESECQAMYAPDSCESCKQLIDSAFQIQNPGTEFCRDCWANIFHVTDEDLGI